MLNSTVNTDLCTVLNFGFREYNLKPVIAEQYREHGALYCAEQYDEKQLCAVLNSMAKNNSVLC